jgi:hypothetical protein
MATYLQGVTDYIPQFQPFQPDLNFYANIMQTKQTQYDTNWKALNKMYSQYYYADLTRDDTTEKKDEYLKNIEFNLKRVSQLDLSLEQNVNQATQVFKPFYEDKLLMKDMAWTKNYNDQLNRAEIFKNSTDPKNHDMYWEEGVRGMNYLKEEFKEATVDDAMSFQNAEYVPNVNVIEKAEKIAKDADLSIEKIEYSDGGKFIIKTKNGEALTEPLQKLFEARLGSDPAVQAKYKMQAYVDRKDYAYSNAAQFGGDKNKAEMKYLENSFNVLKAQSDVRYKQLQLKSDVYKNKIADLQSKIDNGTASPETKLMLEQYKMNKDINDKVLTRAEEESKMLKVNQSKTPSTPGAFVNPYGDLKSLRYKVDNGMASILMLKDLDEAANIYAYREMEVDMEANPYKILEEKQRNSMQLVSARLAASKNLAQFKMDLQKQKDYEDSIIENDQGYRDEKGNIHLYEDQNMVTTGYDKAGNVTPPTNFKEKSREISNMTKKDYLDPYFMSTFSIMDKAMSSGKMTKEEAGKILGYNKNKKISVDEFITKYNTYGDGWLRKHVGSKGLKDIRNKMNEWIGENRDLSIFTSNGQKTPLYKTYRDANMQMNDYMLYIKTDEKFRKDSSKSVITDLKRQGFEGAEYLYDENGNRRSEKEYYKALAKSGGSNRDVKLADYRETMKEIQVLTNEVIGEKSGSVYEMAQARRKLMDDPKMKALLQKKQKLSNELGGVNVDDMSRASRDYDELVNAAAKSYSDASVIKNVPARLPSKGPTEPGTGLYTLGHSRITVNHKSFGIDRAHWNEVARDLSGFEWGGKTDRVSIGGISKDAYDKAGNKHADMGRAVFDKVLKDMTIKKSGLGKFELKVNPIAGASSRTGAVTLMLDPKWIKANTATYDSKKNVKTPGIFTPTEAQMALKNGVTFFMDNKKMNSTMYKSSFQSPIESYVETFDKYELNNIGGDKLKSFTVEKNNLGTGDYITTVRFPVYDPNEGKMVQQEFRNNIGLTGENLVYLRNNVVNNFMDDVDLQNYLDFNNFEKVNQ